VNYITLNGTKGVALRVGSG